MTDVRSQMAELRKALMLFIKQQNFSDAEKMGFAHLYPEWAALVAARREVSAGSVCRYGQNADGEPQLYEFVSNYTPVDTYTPDADPTHYKRVGVTDGGVLYWTQPYGATDAYDVGDERYYNGEIYVNDYPKNAFPPDVWGWHVKGADPAAVSEWAAGTKYYGPNDPDGNPQGKVIDPHDGQRYRCRQTHTALAGWEPHAVPALWEVDT